MNLDEKPTHYEVLNLSPDASVSQIREAYLRVKSTYNKDSLALYTLIEPSEREQMLQQVEEAYAVLSDHEKRKEYDACHGLIDGRADKQPNGRHGDRHAEDEHPLASATVVSIDRVPPMSSHSEEDLLVPPPTDFGSFSPPPAPRSVSAPVAHPPAPRPDPNAFPEELATAIAGETDWTGAFLKRVREARRISIEELSHATKISKTYLFAIEEENFPKLPAAVFVRGFINQVARVLKLPVDTVVTAYMERFKQSRTDAKKQ